MSQSAMRRVAVSVGVILVLVLPFVLFVRYGTEGSGGRSAAEIRSEDLKARLEVDQAVVARARRLMQKSTDKKLINSLESDIADAKADIDAISKERAQLKP